MGEKEPFFTIFESLDPFFGTTSTHPFPLPTFPLPSPSRTSRHHSLPPIGPAGDIHTGYDYTCVMEAGGEVKCWGGNSHGQLGIGSYAQQTSPVTVPGAEGEGGGHLGV